LFRADPVGPYVYNKTILPHFAHGRENGIFF
jgi:hypothetical protein